MRSLNDESYTGTLVIRTLVLAAEPKQNGIGYIFTTDAAIASYCGLTIQRIQIVLEHLVACRHIVYQDHDGGKSFYIPHFSVQRRRFGIIDDPAVTRSIPNGKIAVLSKSPEAKTWLQSAPLRANGEEIVLIDKPQLAEQHQDKKGVTL